jgi:hypothetical protein
MVETVPIRLQIQKFVPSGPTMQSNPPFRQERLDRSLKIIARIVVVEVEMLYSNKEMEPKPLVKVGSGVSEDQARGKVVHYLARPVKLSCLQPCGDLNRKRGSMRLSISEGFRLTGYFSSNEQWKEKIRLFYGVSPSNPVAFWAAARGRRSDASSFARIPRPRQERKRRDRLPRGRSMISILHADGESQLFPRCRFGLRLA